MEELVKDGIHNLHIHIQAILEPIRVLMGHTITAGIQTQRTQFGVILLTLIKGGNIASQLLLLLSVTHLFHIQRLARWVILVVMVEHYKHLLWQHLIIICMTAARSVKKHHFAKKSLWNKIMTVQEESQDVVIEQMVLTICFLLKVMWKMDALMIHLFHAKRIVKWHVNINYNTIDI